MLPDDVANFLDVAQKLKIKGLFHDFIIEEGTSSADDVIIPDVNDRKSSEEAIFEDNIVKNLRTIENLDNKDDDKGRMNSEEGNVEDTVFKKFKATRRLVVKVDDEDNNCLNDSLTEPDALVPLPVKIRPKRKTKEKMKVQKVDENAIGIVDEFVSAEEDTYASLEAEAPGFHGSSYSGSDVVVDGTEITVTAIVDSYIYNEGKEWICKTCGKRSASKHNMRKHAEIHIDGLSFPCQFCDLSYKTRMSWDQHKKLKHSTTKSSK